MGSQSQLPIQLTSEDDIRQFLSEIFGFKLDREAFTRPTREMMYRIYQKFIIELTNKNVDQPNLQAASGMNYLELYMGIIPCINLTAEIRLIFRKWGDLNFHISDILEPKRKRTQLFLTVLITLWVNINEEVFPRWLELSREKSKLQLKERAAKCDQELIMSRRTKEELALKISDLEKGAGDKDRHLQELKELANKRKTEKEDLRRLVGETRLAVAKNDEKKSEIKLETNKLKGKRIELEKKLIEIRNIYTEVDELTEVYQNQMEIKRKIEREISQTQDQISVSKEFNQISATVSEGFSTNCKKLSTHKKLLHEANKLECEIANRLKKEKELNIKEKHAQDFLGAIIKQKREKEDQLESKIAQTKENIKSKETLIKEKEASIVDMEAKYRDLLLEIQNKRQDLTNKKNQIIAEAEAYKSKIETALGGFDKSMEDSIQMISRPLNSSH